MNEQPDVTCPGCGRAVPPADVNIARLIAKCGACDQVFAFAPQRRASTEELIKPPTITVEPAGIADMTGPDAYRDATARGPLTIGYRRSKIIAWFALFFSLFWNGFLVLWYAIALLAGGSLAMWLLPLPQVFIGIALFYWSLSAIVNRTFLSIDGTHLRLRVGPMPWPGALDIELARLRQLFVRQRQHTARNSSWVTYTVTADVDGVDVPLLAKLRSRDEARYIERTIERHLAIVDQPGRG